MTTATYDALAVRARLRGDKAMLKRLAHDAAVAAGAECPACGSRETEDNGFAEYRCCACDHRWGVDTGERYGY